MSPPSTTCSTRGGRLPDRATPSTPTSRCRRARSSTSAAARDRCSTTCAWEDWAAAEPEQVDYAGRALVMTWHIASVADGIVTMTETTADPDGTIPHVGHGRLRFLEPSALNALLEEAGFSIEAQYGDFERGPITEGSRAIVTVARA